MKKRLQVGVAGYGKSAKVFHLPFLDTLPEFEVSAVLERKSDTALERYPQARIARTIDELVSIGSLDLIVITTPNETHFEYASRALRAGKHVVLEKPFTNTLEEGKELMALAAASNTILSVYQNRRYVSDFLTIRDILDQQLLGDVHEFTATYDRYRPGPVAGAWREEDLPGSGILYDLGPHLLDQILFLFGKPAWITADIRKQRSFSKVDDYFNIWLDYGFLKVTLHAGMLVREQGPRYMIQGTKGSFIKYGEDPQENLLKAGVMPVGDDWGKEPEEYHGLLHTEINGETVRKTIPSRKGDYAAYYRGIFQAIVQGTPVTEKPEHGYNTIRLIRLAFESSRKKQTLPCTELM